jgi:hypothetical protein
VKQWLGQLDARNARLRRNTLAYDWAEAHSIVARALQQNLPPLGTPLGGGKDGAKVARTISPQRNAP